MEKLFNYSALDTFTKKSGIEKKKRRKTESKKRKKEKEKRFT